MESPSLSSGNRVRSHGVRFAPSPTGKFHVGNLRTAWISHEWAKFLGVPWIVRFEDIDRPRVQKGAMERQLQDLRELGLVPDRVDVQSEFDGRHWELFRRAVFLKKAYPCFCSRKEIQAAVQASASAPHEAVPSYSGKCRARPEIPVVMPPTVGWRFKAENPSGADDPIIARTAPTFAPESSSFIPAYHWACAIDDWDGDFTLLVRAADLGPATATQRAIQSWLREIGEIEERDRPFASVFHTSLITQNDGQRLEKRTEGVTLEEIAARGIGQKEILRKFAASFDRDIFKSRMARQEIRGEPRERLTLSELGF